MSKKFKPGEKVVLKSGGPRMVVVESYTIHGVRCSWQDENGEVRTGAFQETQLDVFAAERDQERG